MELSVVVPTLNGRDRLASCLDALAETIPDAEVIVVNGPSADGTTGMVRDRDDVDVLVEIADRRLAVARNAGIDQASGDVVALLNHALTVEEGWGDAIRQGLAEGDVVTGPTHQKLRAGMTTESVETGRIKDREVTYVNGDSVAFRRSVLDSIDGFDEYFESGGERDVAHRLAGLDVSVTWRPDMCVRSDFGTDGGVAETEWRETYQSLAYRLTKNYGFRPAVLRRLLGRGARDAVDSLRSVARDSIEPSTWLANGRDVLTGMAVGVKDGVLARLRDRSPRRNPNGRSARSDRAVQIYDWRD